MSANPTILKHKHCNQGFKILNIRNTLFIVAELYQVADAGRIHRHVTASRRCKLETSATDQGQQQQQLDCLC